ncbi:TPA: imidazole glycerol phosphate synthase subunit HisH, partial [Campylobacter coli]|nr:imidazole glycerol phosphate synthase subunit HisH [Campylobacter coli]
MKLIIIDTACANLASLKFCLDRLGFDAKISRDLKDLESADKLFLPGVGTAAKAMSNLESFNLTNFIKNTKKPLLGICLGMQILGDFSEELDQETLSIIPFKTQKFELPKEYSLPHMGWNEVASSHP